LAVPIDSVIEDPTNARVHGVQNLAAIRDSIRAKGQDQPIVVRAEDMMVSKGHGRLEAMRALGYTHIAAVVVDETRISAVERGIADNRSSDLAEMDDLALAALFKELEGEGDVIGWTDDEINGYLTELENSDSSDSGGESDPEVDAGSAPDTGLPDDADEVPEPPAEPVTKPGDVITLGRHTLHCGDCMEILRAMPDNSVDAIVSDPPYGMSPDGRALTWDDVEELRAQGKVPKGGFMGREWDAAVPGVTWARECERVLKPGGYLLAASSPRTYHRLAVSAEDAGFEIRDSIAWLYWQGMPKSMDLSAALEKQKHNREEVLEVTAWVREMRDNAGLTNRNIDTAFGFAGMATHWTSSKTQPTVPTLDKVPMLMEVLQVDDMPPRISELLLDLNEAKGVPGPNWWKREEAGTYDKAAGISKWRANYTDSQAGEPQVRRPEPSTEEGRKWKGWGTGLKPCKEPILVARKRFKGTLVANIQKWGVGAMNIDACRLAAGDPAWPGPNEALDIPPTARDGSTGQGSGSGAEIYGERKNVTYGSHPNGRWPANVFYCPKPSRREREPGCEELPSVKAHEVTGLKEGSPGAKHPRAGMTRQGQVTNVHPTVKPAALMRWLLKLVSPPGSVVVEPFGGSGTTLVAAHGLDLSVIAVEREPAYCDIIRARVEGSGEG
jgi:DNA modification methylase